MKAIVAAGVLLAMGTAIVEPSVASTEQTGQPEQTEQILAQAAPVLRTTIRGDETLYLDEDKTHEYSLRLENAAEINGLSLPAGSLVRGQFEPVDGGLRYVADSVEVGDRIYDLSAFSETLTDQKDPRETDTGDIIEDAAIGAGGGLVLGEILGSPDLIEILGGAAAGVLVGNVTAQTVVVIEPDQAILLYQD